MPIPSTDTKISQICNDHKINNSKPKKNSRTNKSEKTKKINLNRNSYFNENDSVITIIENINLLRSQIRNICESNDSEEKYLDYSYKEMFQLLEDYLNMLPNHRKYGDISYFL